MAGLANKGVVCSPSSVTLSNWKRLSNALLELPMLSAVYWRDFIVVMNTYGECIVYNVKWNMWTRLDPKFPEQPTNGCPLVCFNNRLLALGSSGTMYEFLSEVSRWEKSDIKFDLGYKQSWQVQTELSSASLTSSESTLFIVYMINETKIQSRYVHSQPQATPTQRVLMKMYDGSSWSHPSPLNLGQKKKKKIDIHSVALHSSSTIYISTDENMYSIKVSLPKPVKLITDNEETCTAVTTSPPQFVFKPVYGCTDTTEAKLDMTTHAPPPNKMSTLSVINGSLFSFGGKDQDNQPFATVYCYSPETNSWQVAGSMLSSRYGVAVSKVKREEGGSDVYVIGGYLGESSQAKIGCRIIEYCSASVNGGD